MVDRLGFSVNWRRNINTHANSHEINTIRYVNIYKLK